MMLSTEDGVIFAIAWDRAKEVKRSCLMSVRQRLPLGDTICGIVCIQGGTKAPQVPMLVTKLPGDPEIMNVIWTMIKTMGNEEMHKLGEAQ